MNRPNKAPARKWKARSIVAEEYRQSGWHFLLIGRSDTAEQAHTVAWSAGVFLAAEAGARTCYDHLAGKLGVAVFSDLLRQRALQLKGAGLYEVTRRGERLLSEVGIDTSELRSKRRALARACLDWTEKEPHLAGAIGAAICEAVLDRGWATRRDRALEISDHGKKGFIEWLGTRSLVAAVLYSNPSRQPAHERKSPGQLFPEGS